MQEELAVLLIVLLTIVTRIAFYYDRQWGKKWLFSSEFRMFLVSLYTYQCVTHYALVCHTTYHVLRYPAPEQT
jgi:hypothetical protein